MLSNIRIKNLALIKEADIDLTEGLNIMTGETGAGKSIIIGAINIALGEKANRSMIRSGADSAFVELLFTGTDQRIEDLLKENDIETDFGNVLISRKITHDSSQSRINGQNVTLNTLKKITEVLADIHGQHDHQSLLDPSEHINLLDENAGEKLSQIKKEFADELDVYRSLRVEYKQYEKAPEDVERDQEIMEHELERLKKADIKEGEDHELEAEFKQLSNAEKTAMLLTKSLSILDSEDTSLKGMISDCLRNVEEACGSDERLSDIRGKLLDIEALTCDISHDINSFLDTNRFDPERFDHVKKRLDTINDLKLRYGNSYEAISKAKIELEEKLINLSDHFKRRADLEGKIRASGEKLKEIASRLSEVRKETASMLEIAIKKELEDLNFLSCEFSVSVTKSERITDKGFDNVEFLISTNPGEPLKPLAKIASGGEMSRVMLAIKSEAASRYKTDTLIFDEIDAGISGKTANMVAEKLYKISNDHQIICISHLPQIAAMADSHYHIHKEVEDGNTISGVIRLNDDQMIYEIAKLLGGAEISPAALENARDLKGNANFFKHKLS